MKNNKRTDAQVFKIQDQAKEQRDTEDAWDFSGQLTGKMAILITILKAVADTNLSPSLPLH